MAKQWTDHTEIVDSIASNLMNALSVFPRQVLRTDSVLHACELTMSQLQILISISKHQSSVGDLSLRMGIAKPNITPLVDQLCEMNLAKRVRSDEDRRIVNVHITEAGQEMLGQVQHQISEQVKRWSDALSRTDARNLDEALSAINELPEKLQK